MIRKGRATLQFDRERALSVFRLLIEAWQRRTKGFAGLNPPEAGLPAEMVVGSRIHACYIFAYGTANRYGTSAQELAQKLANLWKVAPWWVDPAMTLRDDSAYSLVGAVIPFGIELPERVDAWLENLDRLRMEFASDPRRIFLEHGKDRDSLVRSLVQFHGIEHKIAQLLGIWFQDVKWSYGKPSEWRRIRRIALSPVDMWVMRLMVMTGIITAFEQDNRDRFSRECSDFICEVCESSSLSHRDLAQAFWHTGSVICAKRPRMAPGDDPEIWQNSERQKLADIHCLGLCPLAEFCRKTILMAGTAYKSGKIGLDQQRPRCHPGNLFVPRPE